MSFIKKRYYFYDFFKTQNNIPRFYGSIVNKTSQTVLYDSFNKDTIEDHDTSKVNHLPDYLQINYNNEYNVNVSTLTRDIGYAVDLSNVSNINAYVSKQFTKGRTIKRHVSRLESIFNITYKRYYGDINKNEYDELLESLFQMVKKRFILLNDINQQINDEARWRTTLKETFSLINEKKASLFVIYEDDIPIVISIGHHWGDVFYYVMCSFNVDYSKFALGHVNFYKQLEWCIDNGYKIFDVGPGEYDYKKRWSNKRYLLLQQVIYKKDDKLVAKVEMKLTIISKYLNSKKVKSYLKYVKKALKKNNYKALEYNISYLSEHEFSLKKYSKIDHKKDNYDFLRKILFDFLYTKTEHKEDVLVYCKLNNNNNNTYIFKGKNNIMQCDIL